MYMSISVLLHTFNNYQIIIPTVLLGKHFTVRVDYSLVIIVSVTAEVVNFHPRLRGSINHNHRGAIISML